MTSKQTPRGSDGVSEMRAKEGTVRRLGQNVGGGTAGVRQVVGWVLGPSGLRRGAGASSE